MGSRSPSTDPSDASVIAGSLQRPEQFAAIFDRHFDSVHAYLARRIGASLADDLASQTFVVAFERRESFRATVDSARPWLFGIATNLMRPTHAAPPRLTGKRVIVSLPGLRNSTGVNATRCSYTHGRASRTRRSPPRSEFRSGPSGHGSREPVRV